MWEREAGEVFIAVIMDLITGTNVSPIQCTSLNVTLNDLQDKMCINK